MDFEKKVPNWNATGAEPSESLKTSGFQGGYKPPASIFNWFWHGVSECLKEIREKLSNVDNTADSDKRVKYAQESGTAEKVKNPFTLYLNGGSTEGTSKFTYDASAGKSVNITPSNIGAAASLHKHNAGDVNGLANVATTGSYYDLKDAPEIPEGTAVDSALSSTSTNPVQNKVVNSALGGKAPTNHAVSTTTYGAGTGSNYGHVKLSDSTSSTSGASSGIAATPAAVKAAYDLANGKADSSHTQAASTISAGTFTGRVQGNATAMATVSNTQFRNIYAGTSDLTAGTSSLTSGTLYFVYE